MTRKGIVGIIGLGSVGSAAYNGMEPHHEMVGYDIDGRGFWGEILQTDTVLVCVQTDLDEEGVALEIGVVKDVASRLDASSYAGLVIIKSTLNVGAMESLHDSHPNLRLVYMPEFLREKDADEWFASPDRLIASGNPEDIADAFSFFEWVSSDVPRVAMRHSEAEFGKLAHNAYIATKVTFTCEIERLCILQGVDPRPVMESVWSDRRVKDTAHLVPGLGGFGGKCVPKDTISLSSNDNLKDGLFQHLMKIGQEKIVGKRHADAAIDNRQDE
jgi:UDPglucose 6-dehydrogenase